MKPGKLFVILIAILFVVAGVTWTINHINPQTVAGDAADDATSGEPAAAVADTQETYIQDVAAANVAARRCDGVSLDYSRSLERMASVKFRFLVRPWRGDAAIELSTEPRRSC
jgi:hypothetical protein